MARTYLFARLWVGFPPNFDASIFDDVPDQHLDVTLLAIAGQWIVEHCTPDETDRVLIWAHKCSEITKDLRKIPIGADSAFTIGTLQMQTLLGADPGLRAPRWCVFHAEGSHRAAAELRDALIAHVRFDVPVRYAIAEARELLATDRIRLERELEEYPRPHLEIADFVPLDSPVRKRWARLRDEARRCSTIITRLHQDENATLEASKGGQVTATASSTDLTPTTVDASAALASLPPAVRRVVEAITAACKHDPELAPEPGKAVAEKLWLAAREHLRGTKRPDLETARRYWRTYTSRLAGREKKTRLSEPTGSMFRARDEQRRG